MAAELATDETHAADSVQPYSMHVSSKYLELTQRKLELTRLPRELELDETRQWIYGTPKKVLEPLVDFWLEHYDWRAQETIFNRVLPQFRTTITLPDKSPLRLHFVHKRSTNPKAVPLLFCHGWPGSFLEVSKIISVLTEAPSTDSGTAPGSEDLPQGGDQIAFHVVAPSIPGFGFSDASLDENFGLRDTADVFDALMKELGYKEYVAHGSDWGFQICRSLALQHSASCLAIHTSNPTLPVPTITRSPLAFFKYQVARITGARFPYIDFGYVPSDFSISQPTPESGFPSMESKQASYFPSRRGEKEVDIESQYVTHPQTASYSLCDSPAGLLASLVDTLKLPSSAHTTSASAASPWTPTDLLNWTMMQWLPGPEAGLRWLANAKRQSETLWSSYSPVPLGISCFRGNGKVPIRTESNVEEGEGSGTELSQIGNAEAPKHEKCHAVCSPPLWAQAVQRLCWVKRHGRCAARPGWEEAGEMGIDMREWAGQLVKEGWLKTEG